MNVQKLLFGKICAAQTVSIFRQTGYTNFGHQSVPKPRIRTIWETAVSAAVCVSIFCCIRNFSVISGKTEMPGNLRATRGGSGKSDGEEEEDLADGFTGLDTDLMETIDESKARPTFRDHKINAYENRIRKFSNPDKVFRYFATIKTTKDCSLPNTILMTPADFVRAITYDNRQPSGLDLDRFRRLNPDVEQWTEVDNSPVNKFPKTSVFKQVPPWGGLLTYTDFLVLLALISIPQDHLKYVFRMVDINENGRFDEKEFKKVVKSLIGSCHQTGGLREVFFRSTEYMELHSFLKFFRELRDELCWIEFYRVSGGADVIDAWQFCRCVLAYVHNTKLRREIGLRALSSLRVEELEITFDEYLNFVHFVERLPEVVRFTEVYKFGLDAETLRALSKNAFGIGLSDSVLRVIFAMFDEDHDGKLNQEEFFSVLRAIQTRGAQAGKKLVYNNGYDRLVGLSKSCILCVFEVFIQKAAKFGRTLFGSLTGQPVSVDKT